jgi:SAM-dependent methyltransferase
MNTTATAAAADVLTPHEWGSAPELYGPRHAYREALLMRRLRKALPAGHALNAGCGGGSFTLRLLDRGYEVTSIDASPLFVEHVRGLLAQRGEDPERARLGDLRAALDFPARTFDAVVCGEVLEHLDDDAAAVREFARVLRPGGVVVASVPANPWRYDWCDHWAGHRRRYTREGLADCFRGAGFAPVEVVSYGFPLTGLYHRRVYMPMLRRRLLAGGVSAGGARGAQRLIAPLLRWAFELDTAFIGRRPGYFGLIVVARLRQRER